jgi:probable rRNA maturation factor
MIRVSVAQPCRRAWVSQRSTVRIVSTILKREKKPDAEVSVVFVGDKNIRKLNREHLSHDFVTDVLTFAMDGSPTLEAEIYVNPRQAERQARKFGVTARNEMIRLIAHGTLHAAGYDDRRTKDKRKMFEKQERYVRLLEQKETSN